MGVRLKQLSICSANAARFYTSSCRNNHKCKLLVVGGGTGGCSVAWRFSKRLKDKEIIVLEPSQVHYCQPLFTLVAAGIKDFKQTSKPLKAVLPPNVLWFQDHAEDFDPSNNVVYTRCGDKIFYEHMVVALGMKNDYDKIPGLKEALENKSSKVSTIYSPRFCTKCWCCIRQFQGGQAVFTFPRQGGKCAGAAQKIMYLADDYWRKNDIRNKTDITYNTGGEALFGVPKYATALNNIVTDRSIAVNFCLELVEITQKGAVFATAGGETVTFPYNFLHVTPPMSPPACLAKCEELANASGHLDVDPHTLRHAAHGNVYGLGDCTSTPNSKTAAAVALQSSILEQNLSNTMEGKDPTAKYNGYGACPLLTSYKTGILAEFLYDKKVWETFPFDQSKERRLLYYLNKNVLPRIYWNKLIKGKWSGPSKIRKIINPFQK